MTRFLKTAILLFALIATVLIIGNAQALANTSLNVVIDGQMVAFTDAQPAIIEGRTLVPVRGVFENMGFLVEWQENTSTAILTRTAAGDNTTVTVRIGDNFIMVNGQPNFPEVPPQILNDRFMLPLRAVAEATGADVQWIEATGTAMITTASLAGAMPTPAPDVAIATPQPTPIPSPTITPVPSPTPTPITIAEFERRVLELTNLERTRVGLPPFIVDETLTRAARSHSEDMARNNFFGHTGTDGSNLAQRMQNAGWAPGNDSFAENITDAYAPEIAINAWMNSERNRENILDPNYTHIGVGVSYAQELTKTTQLFGRIGDTPTPTPAPTPTPTPTPAPAPMTVSDFESRIFELVNIERAAAGIPLLVWNDDLARAARIHSEDMDRNNFTGHTGSDGSSLADRVARVGLGAAWNGLGENVARGQATPEAAMDSWLNSPGHRENILNPSYTQFGAGRSGNATTQKFMSTW